MKTYAFIDASNLFYGGEKSLGWKINYKKLLEYLKEKYSIDIFYYFGGIEIHGMEYDYLKNDSVPVEEVEGHLSGVLNKKLSAKDRETVIRDIQRVKFYKKLKLFGYNLILKPVKIYKKEDGSSEKKANCDVDMAFYLMKDKDNFSKVLILSGDGDFLPVLKHLKNKLNKEIIILSRKERTAREIRRFAGENFKDFEYLKYILKM